MSQPIDLPQHAAVAISRETLDEFDLHRVGDMSRVEMAYWLGQMSASVRALLAHAEPVEKPSAGEASTPGGTPAEAVEELVELMYQSGFLDDSEWGASRANNLALYLIKAGVTLPAEAAVFRTAQAPDTTGGA